MKAIDRALARIMLATAPVLLIAAPAAAQRTYSNLFVFGDSLVDSGNAQVYRAAIRGEDPAPSAAGYFDGRFSNGYNFADDLSFAITGAAATASEKTGLNFSVGGAQARDETGDASFSFAEQIDLFKASRKAFDSNSLVLVTFGGNDVRSELAKFGAHVRDGKDPATFVPDFSASLAAFDKGLNDLYQAGARNFIVTGLPDIGQIPVVTDLRSPLISQTGTIFSRLLNTGYDVTRNIDTPTGIDDTVLNFASATGANATFFDLFDFQKKLAADPAAYGLPSTLDTTRACLRVAGAAPTCDGFTYFDPIHPTKQVHRAIASGLTAQLGIAAVPEPAGWALMIAGFALVAHTMRARRRSIRVVHA